MDQRSQRKIKKILPLLLVDGEGWLQITAGSRNVFIVSPVLTFKRTNDKMSTSAIILANRLIIPEKQVTPTLSDYYILPGSSAIIDLESVIKESFSNATISVSENPGRGETWVEVYMDEPFYGVSSLPSNDVAYFLR